MEVIHVSALAFQPPISLFCAPMRVALKCILVWTVLNPFAGRSVQQNRYGFH